MAEQVTLTVSAAVNLIDAFAPASGLQGAVHLALTPLPPAVPGPPRRAVRVQEGLFAYTDLPPGDYRVDVTGTYYLPAQVLFSAGSLDPDRRIHSITLAPKPYYPFPEGTTLLRGRVTDAQGRALAGVEVEARYETAPPARSLPGASMQQVVASTVTFGQGAYEGQYALYFRPPEPATGPVLTAHLRFAKTGYQSLTQPADVAVGRTTYLDVQMKAG